ncbi:MAG: hypothetical protein ABI843_00915 [Dokdonella sp.]
MITSIVRPFLRSRASTPWVLAAVLLSISSHAFAFATFTVGGDASCNFSTLQDAINASTDPEGNSLFIARDVTYSSQHVLVNGQKINFLGGYETCDGTEAGEPIQITGTSGHSVFEIEGDSAVYLANLDISGGDLDGSHKGGGIYFGGIGSLELASVWVHGNRAGYGGGIDMSPSGTATLTLLSTAISLNTASGQGGGIRLEGFSTLVADASNYITFNAAEGTDDIGFGGGIEMIGPAHAYINANLNNNTAIYGGGIAALAAGDSTVTVNLYNQGILYNNLATVGGGVYLESSQQGAVATLCANDFAIDNNTAAIGAAIYGNDDGGIGASVLLNDDTCLTPLAPIPQVTCATGPFCNEIANNVATDMTGAVIQIGRSGSMSADRTLMRANQGESLIGFFADADSTPGGYSVRLHNSLLTGNIASGDLIDARGGATGNQLIVDTSTIADNQIGAAEVIMADLNFAEVTNSIVYQPDKQTIHFTGPAADLTALYVLTNDTSSLAGGIGILQGTPAFVDSANGDYHLLRGSPGVDVAPEIDDVDLDGNPRSVDLLDIANDFGPSDLGAYEIQTQLPPPTCAVADTIYCNGFEDP